MSEGDGDKVALACNLEALDKQQRKRRDLLLQWLQVGTVDIVDLPDGYAFHLDRVSLAAGHIAEFVALERRCCPFLRLWRPGARPPRVTPGVRHRGERRV